jgi:hypothetical protein
MKSWPLAVSVQPRIFKAERTGPVSAVVLYGGNVPASASSLTARIGRPRKSQILARFVDLPEALC